MRTFSIKKDSIEFKHIKKQEKRQHFRKKNIDNLVLVFPFIPYKFVLKIMFVRCDG